MDATRKWLDDRTRSAGPDVSVTSRRVFSFEFPFCRATNDSVIASLIRQDGATFGKGAGFLTVNPPKTVHVTEDH